MLETRCGACRVKPAHERAGQIDDGLWIAAEGPALESFRRALAADVDDRREINLDIEVAERHADEPPQPSGQLYRLFAFSKRFRARQSTNKVAEAIDPPSLFIDHENRRPSSQRLHLAHQVAELSRVGDVPAEENDRVRTRLADDPTFEFRQRLVG